MKYDSDKPNISLIPPEVLLDVARVFEMGAKKYGVNNWRKDLDVIEWSRTYSSIQRHLLQWHSGEDIDPESNEHHILHAITQLMILYITTQEGASVMDDRFRHEDDE